MQAALVGRRRRLEDTFGGGLSLAFPLGESGLGFEFGGTYYQELTDEPVEGLFDDDENFFFGFF